MPQIPLGPLGTFDTSKKAHIGILIGLVSLIFFEIAAMGSPTMIVFDDKDDGADWIVQIGAFRTQCIGNDCKSSPILQRYQDNEVKCTDQNSNWVLVGKGSDPSNPDTDCSKALVNKCRGSQFFLLIGFGAHLLSLPTPLVPKIVGLGPIENLIGISLCGLASLSYLIVWGIWSTLKNNKIETDKDTCGFKTEGQPHNYGGAFACVLIAWMLVTAQTVLFVLGRGESTQSFGTGKKATKKDKKAAEEMMEAPPPEEVYDEDGGQPQGDDDDL